MEEESKEEPKEGKRVLILDGDSIAYRCALAQEQRSIFVKTPKGKELSFKTRTELKDHLLTIGCPRDRLKEVVEKCVIEDIKENLPLDYALYAIKRHIETLQEKSKADEVKVYTVDYHNFRKELPLPRPYKGGRSLDKPKHLKHCQDYLRVKYSSMPAYGYEVDDLACIVAYEELEKGNTPVMPLYDKDQRSFENVLLMGHKAPYDVFRVQELGNLYKDKSSYKGEGLKWLAHQWIIGDGADNYFGTLLSKKTYGPAKSLKDLSKLDTPQEVLSYVQETFKTLYPTPFVYKDFRGEEVQGDWRQQMDLYYKCARMMRSREDKLDYRELFEKYGVKYE